MRIIAAIVLFFAVATPTTASADDATGTVTTPRASTSWACTTSNGTNSTTYRPTICRP
ncbi:MAG: hypothetical protein ACHREM_17355 [Polyangiales bacterium]